MCNLVEYVYIKSEPAAGTYTYYMSYTRTTESIASRTKYERHTTRVKVPPTSRHSSRWALLGVLRTQICQAETMKSREITRNHPTKPANLNLNTRTAVGWGLSPWLNSTALSGARLVFLAIHAQQRKHANPSSQDHASTQHGSLAWAVHSAQQWYWRDAQVQSTHYISKTEPLPPATERHKKTQIPVEMSRKNRKKKSAKIQLKMSLKNPKIDKISLKYKSCKFLGPLTEQKKQANAPSVQLPCITPRSIPVPHPQHRTHFLACVRSVSYDAVKILYDTATTAQYIYLSTTWYVIYAIFTYISLVWAWGWVYIIYI